MLMREALDTEIQKNFGLVLIGGFGKYRIAGRGRGPQSSRLPTIELPKVWAIYRTPALVLGANGRVHYFLL